MQTPATNSLLSRFDDTLLEQARADCRRHKVASIAWTDENTITAKVSASKGIYTCRVHLKADRSTVCCLDCTCDFGMSGLECRHTASTLLTFIDSPTSIAPNDGSQNSSAPSQSTSAGGHQAISSATGIKSPPAFQDLVTTIFERGGIDSPGAANFKSAARPLPAQALKTDQALADGLIQLARALSDQGGDAHHVNSPLSTKTRPQLIFVIDPNSVGPSVDIFEVSIKKDGSIASSRSLDFDDTPSSAIPLEDLEIFHFWQNLEYWQFERPLVHASKHNDYKACLRMFMARILGTGRARLGSLDGPVLALGPELPGRLSWQSIEDGKRLQVVAEDKNKTYPCVGWSIPWYLHNENNTIGPVKIDIPEPAVRALNFIRPIRNTDVVATASLLADLGLAEIIPELIKGHNIELRQLRLKPKLVATFLAWMKNSGTPTSNGKSADTRALLLAFPPGALTDKGYIDAAGKTIIEKQDRSSEQEQIMQIVKLGFVDITDRVDEANKNNHFFLAHDLASFANLDASTIKQLRSAGLEITRETEEQLRPLLLTERDIRIEIKENRGFWSTMELHIEVQGQKMPLLPILQSALNRLPEVSIDAINTLNRNGQFVADLPNGTLITMPFERIKTMLLALHELLDQGTDKLQVSDLHAAQLLEEMGNTRWFGAERLAELFAQLRALRNPKIVAPPENFNAVLRPYQLEGLSWLQLIARFNLGGILADDMGLGKTVQLLAHVALEKESGRLGSPFLVVCPTSVLPNWLAELERFAPDLSVIAHCGQNRSNAALAGTAKNVDIVLTTYPLMTRDIDTLKQISFHGMALDEAQTIKNPLAKVAQCAKLINAAHRFCLTGTPVENHLGELWSQFDFLMPGVLGDKARFTRHIRNPIEKQGNIERQIALAGRIKPFVLRRTKREVLTDLPDKTVIIKQIELSGKQLDLYETVRLACTEQIQREVAKKGFNQSHIIILDAMLKLRQVCCDPRLVNLPTAKAVEESAKLETLIEMIEQLSAEGRKMLVFSQFTSMLDLIADQLKERKIEYVELRGDTKDRIAPVKKFQGGNIPVFLLSLKAGGVGLNLTAADTVIHFDPWWNPASEDQATDRAYRIGQGKDVFVYKLIAHGTIEQWMLAMQDRKRVLANSIYDKSGNLGAAFTEEDLANLLRPIERI